MPMFLFYTPEYVKSSGFRTFSGGIEMDRCGEIGSFVPCEQNGNHANIIRRNYDKNTTKTWIKTIMLRPIFN